jgi:hypothetical protein
MLQSEGYMVNCKYREQDIHCESGLLYHINGDAVLLEGTSVYCPACEGKGAILTDKGRELLEFLMKFGRPLLRDIIDEVFEERERH